VGLWPENRGLEHLSLGLIVHEEGGAMHNTNLHGICAWKDKIPVRTAQLAFLVILATVGTAACASSSTPPGANKYLGSFEQGGGYLFLRWQEGLEVMIWHDLAGEGTVDSAGFASGRLYVERGTARAADGCSLDWEVQTQDGTAGEVHIRGARYGLEAGNVFLVTTRAGTPAVRQLQRDLSAVPLDHDGILAFAEKDPDLIAFLNELPPASLPGATPTPPLTPTVTAQPTSRPSATTTSRPQSTAAPTSTAQPTSRPSATPDQPQILSFTASPDPVEWKGTVTLTWIMSGMTGAGITRLSPRGDILLETEALDLPASGSIAVKVPDEYNEAVKYYLGARDANGVLYQAYVTVGIICPYDEYMAPRCPLTQDTIWAAYEPFERGHTVWRSDTLQIYVLHADGSYETYEDTWHEGDPVEIPGSPPPGLYAPVRGFGNLYASLPDLRERLGWATAPEKGYTMRVETIPGGSGRYPATSVYFTLPNSEKVNLYPFTSTWEIIR
jgi:hypothetical protein